MKRRQERKYIYATAANGLEVRIPVENFEAWSREQDKIRAGNSKAQAQTVERLRSLMAQK